MDKEHQSNHHQQQHQRSHRQHQDRQQSRDPQEQRREFLWRERVKLELQVQALIARAESLEQAWKVLEQRNVALALLMLTLTAESNGPPAMLSSAEESR